MSPKTATDTVSEIRKNILDYTRIELKHVNKLRM